MPVYEYRCTRCDHQFEVTHAVGQAAPRCERCGGPVRRVFSPVGIVFKGSGFHVTDYRKTPVPADGDGKPSSTEKTASPAKAAKDSGASSGKESSASSASSSSGGPKSK